MDAKRNADAEASNTSNKKDDELKRAIKQAEKQMSSISADIKLLSEEISSASKDSKRLVEQVRYRVHHFPFSPTHSQQCAMKIFYSSQLTVCAQGGTLRDGAKAEF